MSSRYIHTMVKQRRSIPVMNSVLNAVAERLEAADESTIRIPEICEATGVNYGSVYHHFGSRDGVIEAAYEMIFAKLVEEDIEVMRAVNISAVSFEDYVLAMRPLVDIVNMGDDRRLRRALRLRILAAANTRPELRTMIGASQARLTDALTEIVQYGQDREWLRRDITAKAIAVVMQALVFGRNLEDVSATPIDDAQWAAAMGVIFAEVIKYPPEYGIA